ncbi:MAG: Na(+)/H(+) antiporter subunit B [Thermosipho sp. (in: Bacteria)]|nr:Na(+)/H(+) antiporter subunit B [Thermosipho sp. (in: thermotogales)]
MLYQKGVRKLVVIRSVFLILMISITLFAIFSRKPFNSFIFRTILSILAVGLYVLYFAPDVALAEAMLGALLTTFIYLLAFKIHSEIKVGIVKMPVICEKYQENFKGIIPEILNEFARKRNYKVHFIEVSDLNKIKMLLINSEIDIGICYDGDFEILEVPVYLFENSEKNYFEIHELLELNKKITELKKVKNVKISLCFSDKNSILFEEFSEFYSQEKIENIVKKYIRR